MEEKPKKPIFKRWWFWLIVVIVVLGAIGGAGNTGEDAEQETVPSVAATVPTTETTIPTTEATVPTESDAPETTENRDEALSAACSLIEISLAENFSGYDVDYEDSTITVNVWQDGLALALVTAQSEDNQESKDAWETVKDNMTVMSDSIRDLIDTLELEDVMLLVNVLNDQNHDNVLLSITEGVVIYDAMAE